MLQKMILLALAGAIGTLLRYTLSELIHRTGGASFPWGSFAVNMAGCFFAGLLWALFESRWSVTTDTRTIILVGFIGAFTTFSTFILETGEMARSSEWMYMAANITLQNGLGIAILFAGIALGRLGA